LSNEALYSPEEAVGFGILQQGLVTTSNVMRDIITNKRILPSKTRSTENHLTIQRNTVSSRLLLHAERHLELHRNAAIMASARASGTGDIFETAVDSTTGVVQAPLEDGSFQYARPLTIPLVVPAIVAHLKSRNSERLEAGTNKLDLYLRFLTALEDNYPAASILRRVLDAAQDAILAEDLTPRGEEDANLAGTNMDTSLWGLNSFAS
jgi:hypothetical protein